MVDIKVRAELIADSIPVQIKLTHLHAKVPKYSKRGDAGADVYSVEEVVIGPGGTAIVDLGLAIQLPIGYEMQVRSRSGLAAKHGLFVLNAPGTIDSGYRGPCKVILHNTDVHDSYHVHVGERVAQFVIKRAPVASYLEVDYLEASDRGQSGFGSTGK